MKTKSLITVGALFAVSALSAHAAIVITEVMSSSAHSAGTNNADWFELTNTGPIAVNLTNWTWDDNDAMPGSANFGSLTSIAAGQSIIFNGEPVGEEASWISNWGLSGVTVVNLGGAVFQSFGSGGDQVNVYNGSSVLVANVSFSTATMGFSFEWDANGPSLGGTSLNLSVLGENGAFRAISNGQNTGNGPGVDIGSPGSIPEPSSAAALFGACALVGAALRRRRR